MTINGQCKQMCEEVRDEIDCLVQKYPHLMPGIYDAYGQDVLWPDIDFSPASMLKIHGSQNLSYMDYIELQVISSPMWRHSFRTCYYSGLCGLRFCGEVESRNRKHICFKRLFIRGTYMDGTMFDEKEDHVWMVATNFDEAADWIGDDHLKPGDCIMFTADVYCYLKHQKKRLLDFGLKNPSQIQRISMYDLPSDEIIINQTLDRLICDTCCLRDSCYGVYCMRDLSEIEALKAFLYQSLVTADREKYMMDYESATPVVYWKMAKDMEKAILTLRDLKQDWKTKINAATVLRNHLAACSFM